MLMRAQIPHFPDPEFSTPPMRTPRRFLLRPFWLALALVFGLGAFSQAGAQLTAGQNNSRGPQNPEMAVPSSGGGNFTFQDRRIRELNAERQKEMVSDTEKLIKLTAELNTEVAQNHSATLTPDQLRTLIRIEKLAKSVKDKMSNPVQGTIFQDSFPPMSQPAIP